MNRITARIAATIFVMIVVTFTWPQAAQCAGKAHFIYARVTFHNAGPRAKTCLGVRQNAKMVAVNTTELVNNPMPFGAKVQIFSYLDAKKQVWYAQKLPTNIVADIFGRKIRRLVHRRMSLPSRGKTVLHPYYRIDYYFTGKMTPAMQQCNAKICKIYVIY